MDLEKYKLHHKKYLSYYKNYSKTYYQKNKDKFRQYYQRYKLKKSQGFVEDTKKPKKTQRQKIIDKHTKIQRDYEIRRTKFIKDNPHLFSSLEEKEDIEGVNTFFIKS